MTGPLKVPAGAPDQVNNGAVGFSPPALTTPSRIPGMGTIECEPAEFIVIETEIDTPELSAGLCACDGALDDSCRYCRPEIHGDPVTFDTQKNAFTFTPPKFYVSRSPRLMHPSTLVDMELVLAESIKNYSAMEDPGLAVCIVSHEGLALLIDSIHALGGPLCIDCTKNRARYTTHRCGLCDLKLQAWQRGEKI